MKNLERIFGAVVPTFFAATGGVSLSEINRVQAENKQQNDTFWGLLSDATGGVFSKETTFVGAGESSKRIAGSTITAEEIQQYGGVADRSAQTAILMHALKLHKRLALELETKDLRPFVASLWPKVPERPVREEVKDLPEAPVKPEAAKTGAVVSTREFMELSNIDEMIAALVPDVLAQFALSFWQRANELNSRAAVLGKLLSEQGSFFRELVKPLPKGSEQTVSTGVIITLWEKTYSVEQVREFVALREKLQAEYNDLQKQLNGCKKQIKDAVRVYNLEHERQYQLAFGLYQVEVSEHSLAVERLREDAATKHRVALEAYESAYGAYVVEIERLRSAAEHLRQQAQAELAALRVRVE